MNTYLPIPVTILTGFLGVGKTTLINYLLSQPSSEKIAIVENEFGAVGIDGGLLQQHSGVEVIELTNGCVCCSVRGELTEALQELLAKRDQQQINFDRLLLETTGLADPAPVIQTFFVDELLRERLRLDAVITLVDCEHAQQQLNEHRVSVAQVGFADRLILTKLDRVTEKEKENLFDRLRKINARAPILQADHGQIEPDSWLNIHAFNLEENINVDQAFIKSAFPDTRSSSAALLSSSLAQNQALMARSWNDDIASHVLEGGEMDIKKIGAFVEHCIESYGNDMLRYKGVIAIAEQPRKMVIQGVHKVVGYDYGSEWQTGEARKTLLVIIGRNLPINLLRQKFADAQI